MLTEKFQTQLDELIGQRIQVVAFGTSYLGILKEVDYDKGFLIIFSHEQNVTLDLEFVESFEEVQD